MTDRTVRVGVIGVGQIGKHHLNVYKTMPDVEVVAVADVNQAEGERVSQAYGIKNVYTDFRKLLERDDIEAVDVCLHNNYHQPVTVAGLQAGKNVYCEKPMAGSYHDAERMYQVAEETGQKLCIQLNTIWSKEIKAAKYLIELGKLGRLYHARAVGFRRRGRPYVDGYGSPTFVQKEVAAGGALYDMGVYHIAMMLYLLDNPDVMAISGQTYQETAMDEERKKFSGYSVEELGLGFVRLAGNLTLDIFESWAVHLDINEGSSVVGTEGGVRIEPFGYYFNVGDMSVNGSTSLDDFAWRRGVLRGDTAESTQAHWVAALQGKVDLLPAAKLALNTMLISEGIYLSSKLGREVTAEEVRHESKSTAVAV